MKIDDIPTGLRHEYHVKCICGKIFTALTKISNDPEYETEIFIKCDCGEYVEFNLPVN